MTDELIAVEIEVHPMRGCWALAAAEDASIEATRFVDVAHLDGNVKWCQRLIHDRKA